MLKHLATSLCLFSLSLHADCPDPAFVTGYLGNVGVVSGNCQNLPLPPLCAFGSFLINQNPTLQSINRLNPHQLPTTNNFQMFQNPCSISQDTWDLSPSTGVRAGAGSLRMRAGPFLIGMSRTGPVVTGSDYYNNQANDLPNNFALGTTFFFSATETNGTGDDYFSVSTDVINSATCTITYTPNNGSPGKIIDYNVIGNVFHDVYYENLHPALALSTSVLSFLTNVLLSVDGGPVTGYPFGSTVTGKQFQFFVPRSPGTLNPASYVIYAVNKENQPISFKVINSAPDNFFFTAIPTDPAFTGFIRIAALSTNDTVTVNTNWAQTTFYMPENIGNGTDTSNPPSPCPIEDPVCPLSPLAPNWWKTTQVHAIAPTGMSFYMRLPVAWANLFTSLAHATKGIGPNWVKTPGTIQFPSSQAFSDILPAIAMSSTVIADGYYTDFTNAFPGPPFSGDACDFSTNYFLLQFDILMAENLRADYTAFQNANRVLPVYTLTPPPVLNNVAVYTAHAPYVPVKADIMTTATSLTWNYTLSSDIPPPDGQNKPLICFPFWKYLQGTTAGVVNTTPGAGEPFQNFIFNDTVKGTFYTAEAINGAVTFLEGGIPSWYGQPDAHGVPTLFIPPGAILAGQLPLLQTALNRILNQNISLPYFPEEHLDAAYNAGKTCFMLAKSALYIAHFMEQNGSSADAIIAQTRPFLDNAKSILNAYLIGRTPGSSFFVADRSCGGICVNGAGGDGTWQNGPSLQQSTQQTVLSETDSGFDFGNYIYNDHHFFAGYFLLATALVTNWEMIYTPGSYWIELPVMGGDNQQYKVMDFVDFLWRDAHNPFTNDPSQPIYDPDLPYDRYGFPWEGHSVANGLQFNPNVLGRNQESIAEDFNCWLGMNTYAALVLQIAPSAKYQTLYDFSLMNLKLNASAGVLWFKSAPGPVTSQTSYWKGVNMYDPGTGGVPGYLGPSIYIGQFTQATVTNGQVNDNSSQNQTFF